MSSRFKVKIICGYRQDQEHTIDANEAHKAYYLFNHPEKRGTFSNGLALRGADIQRIIPDYNATMGWTTTHRLTDDDYNQMHSEGVLQKFPRILALARSVAYQATPEDLATPLLTLSKGKYTGLGTGSKYAQKVLAAKTPDNE